MEVNAPNVSLKRANSAPDDNAKKFKPTRGTKRKALSSKELSKRAKTKGVKRMSTVPIVSSDNKIRNQRVVISHVKRANEDKENVAPSKSAKPTPKTLAGLKERSTIVSKHNKSEITPYPFRAVSDETPSESKLVPDEKQLVSEKASSSDVKVQTDNAIVEITPSDKELLTDWYENVFMFTGEPEGFDDIPDDDVIDEKERSTDYDHSVQDLIELIVRSKDDIVIEVDDVEFVVDLLNELRTNGGNSSLDGELTSIPRPFNKGMISTLFTYSKTVMIDSSKLHFITCGMTLANLFSESQVSFVDTMAASFPLMKIGPIYVRLSNFVFLINDTTAITNQMYLYHVTPSQESSFRFYITEDGETKGVPLDNLTPLVAMTSSSNMNEIELKRDSTAIADTLNFRPYAALDADDLQSETDTLFERIPFIMNRKQFRIAKAGDCVDLKYESSLNTTWIPSKSEYFRLTKTDNEGSLYCVPTRNAPLLISDLRTNVNVHEGVVFDRANRYDFFTCPTIKNNVGLVPQRVSAVLEIECEIEFLNRNEAFLDDVNTLQFSYGEWKPSQVNVNEPIIAFIQ